MIDEVSIEQFHQSLTQCLIWSGTFNEEEYSTWLREGVEEYPIWLQGGIVDEHNMNKWISRII